MVLNVLLTARTYNQAAGEEKGKSFLIYKSRGLISKDFGSHIMLSSRLLLLAPWLIKMILISILHKKSLVSKQRVCFAAKAELP